MPGARRAIHEPKASVYLQGFDVHSTVLLVFAPVHPVEQSVQLRTPAHFYLKPVQRLDHFDLFYIALRHCNRKITCQSQVYVLVN